MAYERGRQALNLEMPDTIPHTEYVDNWGIVRHVTRLDPSDPDLREEAFRRFYKELDYDLLWNTNDGPVSWSKLGRTTDMGHAEYLEDASDYRAPTPSPFRAVEDVLAFDAVEEYGLPDFDDLVEYYEGNYRSGQAVHPHLVFPGGYYKTIISGCIEAFGWEMLLLSVGSEPRAFDRVLEGIFQRSLYHFQAWAKTSIEAFICHDDFVWTQGAIFHPEWYREHVFPRYAKLWSVLKDAGKKVLFCSDGDYTEFVDDIARAGAEGFIFEPATSLETIVARYGKSHVIIGNADCRILTYGSRGEIRAEVERCARLGRDCPGYFFAVGNHIPVEVPIDNLLYYFQLCQELGRR